MTDPSTRAQIRDFLGRLVRDRELSDEQDLLQLGFINSLFAMQLVLFIESTFAIRLAQEDLDLENFRSVNAIVRLVEQKQNKGNAP